MAVLAARGSWSAVWSCLALTCSGLCWCCGNSLVHPDAPPNPAEPCHRGSRAIAQGEHCSQAKPSQFAGEGAKPLMGRAGKHQAMHTASTCPWLLSLTPGPCPQPAGWLPGTGPASCHCHPFSALPAAQDTYPAVPLLLLVLSPEVQTGQRVLPRSSELRNEPASIAATTGGSLLDDCGF